jgi:hypothetical protein
MEEEGGGMDEEGGRGRVRRGADVAELLVSTTVSSFFLSSVSPCSCGVLEREVLSVADMTDVCRCRCVSLSQREKA